MADWIAVDAEVAPVLSAAKSATASTTEPLALRCSWLWFVRWPVVPLVTEVDSNAIRAPRRSAAQRPDGA
jgi:hypothetical protein